MEVDHLNGCRIAVVVVRPLIDRKYTIVVLGLDNSGKSYLVNSLKKNPQNSVMPTIGFSKCDVSMKNVIVTFYDLGGCAGIRDIWKNYYAEAHGLIYVVDGTDWSRVEESRLALSNVLSHGWVHGKPLLVIINTRRAREDISELVFVEQLQLRRYAYAAQCPYRAIACSPNGSCRQRMMLKHAMHWLLRQIEMSSDWLCDKIAADRAVQKRQLEEENAKRLERIRKTRSPLRRSEPVSSSSPSDGSYTKSDADRPHKTTGEHKGETVSNGNDVESIELSAPLAISAAKASTPTDHTISEELESRTEQTGRVGRRRKRRRLAHFNRVVPIGEIK
ncbi:ADP-ribosylation factor family protein [Trichuris suis]|nr:ADP-ribosylation factor family protein [Trichuris suis]